MYWVPETKLLDEKRAEYVTRVLSGELAIVSQQKPRRAWSKPQVISEVGCLDLMDRSATIFPMVLHENPNTGLLEASAADNLSVEARAYCQRLGVGVLELAAHAMAVLHAPAYATESAGALTQDWPRVPLPGSRDVLRESSGLGTRLIALFVGDEKGIGSQYGVLSTVDGVSLDPATGLAVTARWGTAGKGGITMPSTGKLTEREHTDDEGAAIAETAESFDMSAEQAIELLGETCYDVCLNDVAYWRCVPANVWRYTIGGYQVIKKWLSYRERALLGRDLRPEEARYVTEMVRRIAALVLMGPELDANYERVKADVWEWGG